jgi:hypothetical protein
MYALKWAFALCPTHPHTLCNLASSSSTVSNSSVPGFQLKPQISYNLISAPSWVSLCTTCHDHCSFLQLSSSHYSRVGPHGSTFIQLYFIYFLIIRHHQMSHSSVLFSSSTILALSFLGLATAAQTCVSNDNGQCMTRFAQPHIHMYMFCAYVISTLYQLLEESQMWTSKRYFSCALFSQLYTLRNELRYHFCLLQLYYPSGSPK